MIGIIQAEMMVGEIRVVVPQMEVYLTSRYILKEDLLDRIWGKRDRKKPRFLAYATHRIELLYSVRQGKLEKK